MVPKDKKIPDAPSSLLESCYPEFPEWQDSWPCLLKCHAGPQCQGVGTPARVGTAGKMARANLKAQGLGGREGMRGPRPYHQCSQAGSSCPLGPATHFPDSPPGRQRPPARGQPLYLPSGSIPIPQAQTPNPSLSPTPNSQLPGQLPQNT